MGLNSYVASIPGAWTFVKRIELPGSRCAWPLPGRSVWPAGQPVLQSRRVSEPL